MEIKINRLDDELLGVEGMKNVQMADLQHDSVRQWVDMQKNDNLAMLEEDVVYVWSIGGEKIHFKKTIDCEFVMVGATRPIHRGQLNRMRTEGSVYKSPYQD